MRISLKSVRNASVLRLGGSLAPSRSGTIDHCDRPGFERTTLTRNLRPLIARDFVRIDGGSDRRVRVVEITEQGIAAAENALPYWQKAQLELTSKVGTAALKSFEQIQSSAS